MIIENFRTRSAGTRVPHHPEIVLGTNSNDSLGGHTDLFYPDFFGLIIFFKDCDPELVLGQSEYFCQKSPGIVDGIGFEIIAKAEIAQHLEKRVMPRGVANVVEVIVFATGPYATLRGRCALVVAHVITGKDILELHHSCIGEEQGLVIARYQRTGGNNLVSVFLEKLEKLITDIRCGNIPRNRHEQAFRAD